jgi:3-hydroxyisobutyrate dehydrogenase-like beta-hydroxyacid dehydrogenase
VARAAGIPDERYFSILKLNTSYSRLADIKQPKLQTGDYSPQFSIKHMAKDLRIALGDNEALRLPQTTALLKMYEEAVGNGWADDDFVALMKLIK